MKIAIMATGGVGGYFGARLAAAGEDVHFIARGQHLAALRANGLVLKSANGDLHLQSVSATDDPASIGTVDIIIFAVKQYDTESAAKLIKPAIGAAVTADPTARPSPSRRPRPSHPQCPRRRTVGRRATHCAGG